MSDHTDDRIFDDGTVAEGAGLVAGKGLMIRYPFPLGDGRVASVELPEDVTEGDVERLVDMVRALPYEHTEKCEAVVAGFCNAPSVGVVGVDHSTYCADHIDRAREMEARST